MKFMEGSKIFNGMENMKAKDTEEDNPLVCSGNYQTV
jgi:hypothetical protein